MKTLTVNNATCQVWQNPDGSLFITENGYESIPNAGLFIQNSGGIKAVLDACKEVADPTDDSKEHGYVFCYQNPRSVTYTYYAPRVLATSPEEAIKAIETWHNYSNPKNPTLVVNDYARKKIESYFTEGINPNFETFCTTNCGSWHISVAKAKANNLAGHCAIRRIKAMKERAERIAKAKAEKDRKMTEMHIIRKGWYAVYLTFVAFVYDMRKGMVPREKTFTGMCIAKSQMDAFFKAQKEIESKYPELSGNDYGDPTNESTFDASFLGMKTDHGYSLEAWEEFSKTEEYKQSLND